MQLCESAEREKNLNKMNDSVMNAFKLSRDSPLKEKFVLEVDADHPSVIEAANKVKEQCAQIMEKEKERHRDFEYM